MLIYTFVLFSFLFSIVPVDLSSFLQTFNGL